MEKVFNHLSLSEGRDQAIKLVHWMYSYLKIGIKVKIERGIVFDLHDAARFNTISYQQCLDELAHITRESYPLEQFIQEIKESEFDNIIIEFELWDKKHELQKFEEVRNRILKSE